MSNKQHYEAYAKGWDAFQNGNSFEDNQNQGWVDGYIDAKLEQDLEVNQAELECEADYDRNRK